MNEAGNEARVASGRHYVTGLAAASLPNSGLLEHALALRGKPATVAFLKWAFCAGLWKALMRQVFVSEEDTAVFNYRLRVGIADVVVFHVDGSATVIQVEDGDRGCHAVVGGLGDLGLCAAQLDPAKALRGVRRALVWTPVSSPDGANPIIDHICKEAGAIPVFLPAVGSLTKVVMRQQLETVLEMVGDVMRPEIQ